jgi:hypothetical protein
MPRRYAAERQKARENDMPLSILLDYRANVAYISVITGRRGTWAEEAVRL